MAVSSDDLRHVQMQVDKLKERLDYMAPMLSLLNFTQDYFQKVESEASVQLLRIKNSRTLPIVPAAPEGKMIETAKWLHTMTDLVMSLHGGQIVSPAIGERSPQSREEISAKINAGANRAGDQPATNSKGSSTPVQKEISPSQSSVSSGSYPAPQGMSSSSYAPKTNDPRPVDATDAGMVDPRRMRNQTVAQPHGGGKSSLDSTLEFRGLSLGKGTWANAYRSATGTRRDALRLLGTSGIVTERELADDLTEISDEHVEECISIAMQMLKKWPPERGPLPQREAKAFFEEQLAALYMKRAPPNF